jgi:2-octaprenylphenol hydroxylase
LKQTGDDQPQADDCDLLIVGAGLVGATLACYLCQQQPDLRVTLLDASSEPEAYSGDDFDPRVVALSPGSQRLLDQLGVWSKILAARACPYREMQVWDAEGTASINFTSEQLHLPALGHIVENSVAVRALHQRLREQEASGKLRCLLDKRLTQLHVPQADGLVQVELESGERLNARLLIAADGATSAIRDMAGFETREWDYGQAAIVTTVRTAESHEFTAWQRFQTSGPLAFLPLQANVPGAAGAEEKTNDSCYSSIVWSIIAERAETLMQLDDAAFCDELGKAFEHRLGSVVHTGKRHCLPLQQRHAVRYWQPGIALVGDAAHSLHPLAGQGVNLGLRDAQVLGEEIMRACRRKIPLNDTSVLRRYERRRQGHNLAAMATMEMFKRLFAAETPALRWLRNAGMSFVDRQAWLKKRLAALAIQ